MKNLKNEIALFFCCLSSFGASTDSFTETMHGNYTYSVLEPLYCTSESQHYEVNYLFAAGSTHAFNVVLQNAVTEDLFAKNVLPSKTIDLVPLEKYHRYHYANYHLLIEFDIPTRYVDKTSGNRLFFNDYLYEEINGVERATNRHAGEVILYAYHPKVWNEDLYGSSALERPYPGLVKIRDGFYPQVAPFRTEHTGFARGFLDPLNNCFPLRQMKIRCRDCEKYFVSPPYREAYLDINGDLSGFSIGKAITVSGGPHLHFPLVFEPEGDSFFHFALQDTYYVSPDLRTMRSAADRLSTDLPTNDLFLPPLSAGMSASYEVTLSVLGFGDLGLDSIITTFYVGKDHNEFGSCATSDWCVVEK